MPVKATTKNPVPKKVYADRTGSLSTAELLIARGKVIGKLGPSCTLWTSNATAKQTGTDAVSAAATVEASNAKVVQLQLQLDAAKTQLALDMVAGVSKMNLYLTCVEDGVTTAKDMQDAGVDPLQERTYTFASPLGLTCKSDPNLHDLRAQVKRAPGMSRCEIEASTDPSFATGVLRFPGDGARQNLGPVAPGTYSVRARHVRAQERSAFTEAVSVVVK